MNKTLEFRDNIPPMHLWKPVRWWVRQSDGACVQFLTSTTFRTAGSYDKEFIRLPEAFAPRTMTWTEAEAEAIKASHVATIEYSAAPRSALYFGHVTIAIGNLLDEAVECVIGSRNGLKADCGPNLREVIDQSFRNNGITVLSGLGLGTIQDLIITVDSPSYTDLPGLKAALVQLYRNALITATTKPRVKTIAVGDLLGSENPVQIRVMAGALAEVLSKIAAANYFDRIVVLVKDAARFEAVCRAMQIEVDSQPPATQHCKIDPKNIARPTQILSEVCDGLMRGDMTARQAVALIECVRHALADMDKAQPPTDILIKVTDVIVQDQGPGHGPVVTIVYDNGVKYTIGKKKPS